MAEEEKERESLVLRKLGPALPRLGCHQLLLRDGAREARAHASEECMRRIVDGTVVAVYAHSLETGSADSPPRAWWFVELHMVVPHGPCPDAEA